MQDSEKSQTGKTNVLCSDKRIFVKVQNKTTSIISVIIIHVSVILFK